MELDSCASSNGLQAAIPYLARRWRLSWAAGLCQRSEAATEDVASRLGVSPRNRVPPHENRKADGTLHERPCPDPI
jgi:hypothetical protein